jgi:cell division protein FtsL
MTSNPAVLRRRAAVELDDAVALQLHKPKLRPWIVFTLTVVVAFFGMIYSRISLDRTAFELDELEGRIAEEEARFLELEVEVAQLVDPARIDRAAAELGLQYPAELVSMDVPVIEAEGLDPGARLAQLDIFWSAQP